MCANGPTLNRLKFTKHAVRGAGGERGRGEWAGPCALCLGPGKWVTALDTGDLFLL